MQPCNDYKQAFHARNNAFDLYNNSYGRIWKRGKGVNDTSNFYWPFIYRHWKLFSKDKEELHYGDKATLDS